MRRWNLRHNREMSTEDMVMVSPSRSESYQKITRSWFNESLDGVSSRVLERNQTTLHKFTQRHFHEIDAARTNLRIYLAILSRAGRAKPLRPAPMPSELIKTHKQFTNSFFVVIYSYCERFAFSRSSCARWAGKIYEDSGNFFFPESFAVFCPEWSKILLFQQLF